MFGENDEEAELGGTGQDTSDGPPLSRFKTTYSCLNTLLLQSFRIMPETDTVADGNNNEEEVVFKEKVKATGSWKSVVSWGQNASLDN